MGTRLTYTSGASTPELDAEFERELENARAGSRRTLPHLVGGKPREEGEELVRLDPSRGEPVSRAREARASLVQEAVAAAREAQPAWRALGYEERCRLLRADLPGLFVEPTVVDGLPPGHRLTRDELFLPFLTLTRVGSFEEALAEASAIDYGLTAGIFSEDGEEVERFLDGIEAGVVYVNRRAVAATGAWPGIHSFPGWKSSGATGKGGLGPYYVQQFMREQSQTVVRR